MPTRKTRRRQRGSGPWRQGADTCVVKPIVACQGPQPNLPRGPNAYISRVTDPTDRAKLVEDLLKTKFKILIDADWVTAYTVACTPKYKPSDLIPDPSFYRKYPTNTGLACEQKIYPFNRTPDQLRYDAFRRGISETQNLNYESHNQVNMLSERAGDAFADFKSGVPIREAFLMFQNAMSAAVELVPDDGPWIIHTDLHANNILQSSKYTASPKFMLHDWGRSLVIMDPKLPQGITSGVAEFVNDVYPPAKWGKIPTGWQMPPELVKAAEELKSLKDAINAKNAGITPESNVAKLRVWTIYMVFKNILAHFAVPDRHTEIHPPPTIPDSQLIKGRDITIWREKVLSDILIYLIQHAASQALLVGAINSIATKLLMKKGTRTIRYVVDPVPI